MYSITDVLKTLPDNFVPIWYEPMFRGNAVQRIVSAHPECAWEKSWCSSPDPSNTSPLDFPETHSAYIGSEMNIKKLGEMESHAWAHTGFGLHSLNLGTLKMFNRAAKLYTDKLVFFSQHPTNIWVGTDLKKMNKTLISIKKQNIVLYSSKPVTRPFKSQKPPKILEPIDNDNVFNIDIAKLFSDDYTTFLEEYTQITDYFSLTPKPNAIRAFILRYLEREKHVSLAKS